MKLLENVARFSTYPDSLKNGIILLFAAWIWHLAVLYLVLLQGYLPPRQFVSGFVACTCIFTLKKWARALVILVNVFALLQLLPTAYALLQAGKTQSGVYVAISVVLFAAAAFFLSIKPTGDFFQRIHEEEKKEQKPSPYEK